MNQYHVVFGAYVRMYAEHIIHAEDDETARKKAIQDFRCRSAEYQWLDANYDNLALPSIVSIQLDDPLGDILEGYDFTITPADARQYAAEKLLNALLDLMPDIESDIDQRQHSGNDEDWIKLARKAAIAQAAIAEATQLDQQNSEPRP